MTRIIIALTLCGTFAAPAFAASYYFVATDAQGKCHIFEGTNPNDKPSGVHGGYYMSREDAQKAIETDKDCPK